MCGILAVRGPSLVSQAQTQEMLLTLAKRGPEDRGTLLFDGCILGQTRLSIIDLAGGHQPMKDGRREIAITFNGEIYNYRELKRELEQRGYTFTTDSDTEVILKMYQEHGTACVKYLDGMFAFVIWDQEYERLFFARDRFGKKPLYYAFDEAGNLLIASEIKALLASKSIHRVLNREALDNYLALMYLPPWKTIYKNIHTLPPAHLAVFEQGTLSITRYWRLEKTPLMIGYEEAKEEVRRLLDLSVQKRLVADVEIGSFLSGGVDSTLVTWFAQKYMVRPIKTFSVGYQDYINELPYALQAATKIGSDHYPLQAKDDMVEELHAVMRYYDEPHADSSDFPQSVLSRFAASKVKVALAGDGADELFLGYGWHTRHQHLSYRKHFIEKVFKSPFAGFLDSIQVFSLSERERLWKEKGLATVDFIHPDIQNTALSSVEKINQFDFTTYLPGQLLTKADRMGMMHSLEVRSPFLDIPLAEFVYRLPTEYKATKQEGKILLKDILAEIMPREFVYRRKQGFGAPVKRWLQQGVFKADVYATLGSPTALVYDLFQKRVVDGLLKAFYEQQDERPFYKIWVLYCLELWLLEHSSYQLT